MPGPRVRRWALCANAIVRARSRPRTLLATTTALIPELRIRANAGASREGAKVASIITPHRAPLEPRAASDEGPTLSPAANAVHGSTRPKPPERVIAATAI